MKLVRGFDQIEDSISVVANVVDNIWKYGLYICPDIDTILYGLSGLLDVEKGWGIEGDTFNFINLAGKLGLENWFCIGDLDLATHILRTELIRKGLNLTQVTEHFRSVYKLRARIIPITDDSIETRVVTNKGEMNIQEFWVKYKAEPNVVDVKYNGASNSKLTPSVLSLIRSSEKIVIAPGNPISSIGPSLAIPGFRDELAKVKKKVIAISPLQGREPFSGPAAKYMRALKLDISPLGIALYYSNVISSIVISKEDKVYEDALKELGLDVYLYDITMNSVVEATRLASFVKGIVANIRK